MILGTSNPGQTLGFALAKGLISGLARCQPAIEIFNVLSIFGCILVESTRRLSVDVLHALDHMR